MTVALLAIAATVVTHHVTSYMLVVGLLLLSLAALATASFRTAAWAGGLALLSAAAALGWLVVAAPSTVTYLQPFLQSTLHSFQSLLSGGHGSAPSTSTGPLSNRALAALGVRRVGPAAHWLVADLEAVPRPGLAPGPGHHVGQLVPGRHRAVHRGGRQ